MDYTAERHAFPGHNSRKVKTFRGLYRGKACNSKLFNINTDFPMVKFAESQNFPRIILRKCMLFRRVICGKSKLSANYLVPCAKFQSTAESQNLTFIGLSLLPQIILESQPWVTSTTLDLKEKLKNMV